MAVDWTKAQIAAIRTGGQSLLVSAAAGSGKTAVLAERCAYLICDAPEPCDADELLVVTFTEAAAAEMRGRIHRALAERVAGDPSPSPRLRKQLALIEHAPIGTMHGFCSRLLRQNFSAAGIDPRFEIIDGDEASLLRREVARDLFDEHYERDSNRRFRAFIDAYGDGRDDELMRQVCQTHQMLCSLAWPKRWVADSLRRLGDAADEPLTESELGRLLLGGVEKALNRLQRRCAHAVALMRNFKIFPGYVKHLEEWGALIETWKSIFATRGYDALVDAVKGFEPPKAPPVKEGTPNKEQAKSQYDAVKEQLREGVLSELLLFSEAQWRAGQQAVVPHAQVFFSLVEEFGHRYAQAKTDMGGLDFADLEGKSLDLLRLPHPAKLLPSEVARACHRQYKHVLVDEYQDINQIQDSILALLSTERITEEGYYTANLFAVGDVKQSIYRFRLAEPERFLERGRRFRSKGSRLGSVIDLRENFRSRPPLLEAINQVFQRVMTEEAAEIEYDQTHRLSAGLSPEPSDSAQAPIELHLLPRNGGGEEDELEGVEIEALAAARRIHQLIADGSCKFGDIAILLRSMKHKADEFTKILRGRGIPVHNTGGAGFFEATEVRDMLSLLTLLDNQRQDIPLAAFLRSPLAQLSECENIFARVRLAYNDRTIPFHQAVMTYVAEQTDETASHLREPLGRLSRWRDLARQRPLADLIWHIYQETGYLTYVAGLSDGSQRVANLLYLHQRARDFGSFLKQGLHRFMDFLSDLREESDLSLPSISSEGEQSVRIMSIHHSKGLEFPIVIVPDLGKRHNLSDASGSILLDRRGGAGFKVIDQAKRIRYPSLSWALTHESLCRQTRAEELRILYVAMTRAERRLILIGTAGESASRTWALNYRGHQGPLAADEIQSSNSMLDWLGPVQAICGDDIIKLTPYTAEDVSILCAEAAKVASHDEKLVRFAAHKPLDPAPALTDQAASVIARLEYAYPHQLYTQLAAATSPTALAPSTGGLGDSEGANLAVELPLPAFLSEQSTSALTAAQIGEATHLVLEHLDYHRPCDLVDINAQIAELGNRRLLSAPAAAAVNRAAIEWFAASDLGRLLKSNADKLWRELPFALAHTTASDDPADAVMIRGRIDLIVPVGDGVAVVDYKTDRLTAEQVNQRADHYRTQVQTYRDALTRVAGKTVSAVYLVFLHPRIIHVMT